MSQDDFKGAQALVDALRADLPSARAQARVRLQLMAAGVVVASAGAPAAAAAANGGAAVAGGAWGACATKLAASSWATKLAVAAVASALVAAPTAMLALSPRVPVEEGLVAARQHVEVTAQVAVTASEGAQGRVLAAERPAAVSSPAPDTRAQLMAARSSSAGVVPKPLAKAARASVVPLGSMLPALSPPASTSSATAPVAVVSARVPVWVGGTPQPQPTAASTGAESTSRATPEPAPESSSASAQATSAPQPTTSAPSTPVDDVSGVTRPGSTSGRAPQPSAADQPAKLYAGPELTLPQLAGVRRGPASELAREIQLIERALAALRVDDVPAARSWLNLHAARYPDGLLSRDRERVLLRIEESSH